MVSAVFQVVGRMASVVGAANEGRGATFYFTLPTHVTISLGRLIVFVRRVWQHRGLADGSAHLSISVGRIHRASARKF